jgi:hypothetical protein
VKRVISSIPGIFETSKPRAPATRAPGAPRTYSSITAGKFPSDVNYACSVFQLDLVFLPHILQQQGGLVVDTTRPTIPALTCVCVGSRRAFVRRLQSKEHKHVYERLADIMEEIYAAFGERLRLDEERLRGSRYYTEAAFKERCDAAEIRRAEAKQKLAASARLNKNGRLVNTRTVDYYELSSDAVRGPFHAEWERFEKDAKGRPFMRDLRYSLPIGRKDQETFDPDVDEESRVDNWLVDMQDMQLRDDGPSGPSGTSGPGGPSGPSAPTEVTRPWHRAHHHLTFVTDDGEFLHSRQHSYELAKGKGHPAPHWCTVNKSEIPRKGVQIVERFHRTLRSMWAIALTMQTPIAAGRTVDYLLEVTIPATYNATRSSSTMCRPDDLWDFREFDGTAQRAHVALIDKFPVGSLVTIPARTTAQESHIVVHRRDEVYEVVGENIYTREIALAVLKQESGAPGADGADGAEERGVITLTLGPIAPHELRGISATQARLMERMRGNNVSVKRGVKRGGMAVVRELAALNGKSVYSNEGTVESGTTSRAAKKFIDENGLHTIVKANKKSQVPKAEVIGMTVKAAMNVEYADGDRTWKYGPSDLQADIDAGRVMLVPPRTLRSDRTANSQVVSTARRSARTSAASTAQARRMGTVVAQATRGIPKAAESAESAESNEVRNESNEVRNEASASQLVDEAQSPTRDSDSYSVEEPGYEQERPAVYGRRRMYAPMGGFEGPSVEKS